LLNSLVSWCACLAVGRVGGELAMSDELSDCPPRSVCVLRSDVLVAIGSYLCGIITFATVIGWLHGRTRGLTKPTILLVDNAEEAMQPHAGLVGTLSRLLAAAPAGHLRLLVTSRVPVPVHGRVVQVETCENPC